jgi:hypothetical protein
LGTRSSSKKHLNHLRALPAAEPVTDTGKVRWLWAEIQAALASGKTLREVWEAMQLDGLKIPYPQFRVYVSRLKARELKARELAAPIIHQSTPEVGSPSNPQSEAVDPFRNIKKQRHEKEQNGFDFDPFSITKDLVG